MPAVFFDRDGVVNVERGHIASEDDVELYPGVAEAPKTAEKNAGYYVSSSRISRSSLEANAVWTRFEGSMAGLTCFSGRAAPILMPGMSVRIIRTEDFP